MIRWSTVGIAIVVWKWLEVNRLQGGSARLTWHHSRWLKFLLWDSKFLTNLEDFRPELVVPLGLRVFSHVLLSDIPHQTVGLALKYIYIAALNLFGNGQQWGKDVIKDSKSNNDGRVPQRCQKNPCLRFRICLLGWGYLDVNVRVECNKASDHLLERSIIHMNTLLRSSATTSIDRRNLIQDTMLSAHHLKDIFNNSFIMNIKTFTNNEQVQGI